MNRRVIGFSLVLLLLGAGAGYAWAAEEIAAQVGVPLGTVKAQIHHGRRLVRPMLAAGDA